MNLIPKGVTRTVGRTVLKAKKNSPHIFFGAGIAGVVTSTVLACRATLKLEKELDPIRSELLEVKHRALKSEESGEGYSSEAEYRRDLGRVYGRSAYRVGKLYGPSFVVGVASIGALTGSHVQMTRRNSALTATLAAVSSAYDEYRQRMREELGEEREFEIYHGITEEKDEDGKKIKVVNTTGYSQYAKIFDRTCPRYENSSEHNRMFIKCQETYANHLLQSRGHVFLNDVYDMLGFERTQAGQLVGWVRDNENGDGFIDFGLYDGEMAARFINGLEDSIILDFNVDGVVYNMI